MVNNNILAFCAHPDDQIIGPGGTLAKYSQEGKKVRTFIFTYEDMARHITENKDNHEKILEESREADKIIGGKGVEILGIKNLLTELENPKLKKEIVAILKKYTPSKVFTHTSHDPHPEHKAVSKAILQCVKETCSSCEVYGFEVWNILRRKNREFPKLLVDISDTFEKKVDALECFRSLTTAILKLSVYYKAFRNGMKNETKFAELFYKLK